MLCDYMQTVENIHRRGHAHVVFNTHHFIREIGHLIGSTKSKRKIFVISPAKGELAFNGLCFMHGIFFTLSGPIPTTGDGEHILKLYLNSQVVDEH